MYRNNTNKSYPWRHFRVRSLAVVEKATSIHAQRQKFLDIGCGSGVFTTGAALRGYDCIGLSWDENKQRIASERAALCGAKTISFPIHDVRSLDKCAEFHEVFNIAICFECIEHIVDDRKLMVDVGRCLKPGGLLLLTTPNYFSHAISEGDKGPFPPIEDGWHVRSGYTRAMLNELCSEAGLTIDEVTFCSGFFSQMICRAQRKIRPQLLAWGLTFPLRILPILFDGLVARLTGWPGFSICIQAYKPRFERTEISDASTPVVAALKEKALAQ